MCSRIALSPPWLTIERSDRGASRSPSAQGACGFRAAKFSSWTRLFERGNGRGLSPWATRLKFLAGNLQRWRAAPAEGVDSDEVYDERSSPRFELGPTPRVAAVFLLISHLAAPLFPRFEASMMNASTEQFACSTVKLQERRRSFIDKKERPGWPNSAAVEAGSSSDCSRGLLSAFRLQRRFSAYTSKRRKSGRSRRRSFVSLFLSQMGTRTQIANSGYSGRCRHYKHEICSHLCTPI